MRAGQTLALAGLIQDRVEAQSRGIPVLADMPWAGTFFRRTVQQQNEIELLVMVRPEYADAMDRHEVPMFGPGEHTTVPNDKEMYMRGYMEVPNCCPDGSCLKCRAGRGRYAGSGNGPMMMPGGIIQEGVPVDGRVIEGAPAGGSPSDVDLPSASSTPTSDSNMMPFGMRPPSKNVGEPTQVIKSALKQKSRRTALKSRWGR